MTQMIHAPVRPAWRPRVLASIALTVALAIRLLPRERWRMRTRLALAWSVRALPAADVRQVRELYEAVVACQPHWWRGQIDCKERSLATVLATAIAGHSCHIVLGARTLPTAFHAWVKTADGIDIGDDEAGGQDHPWTPVYTTQ
ncbi:lasso peptide biosynthesis B2 protein [Streptomyces lydicus]|uniref:lasso peptide biosynthesis B2 protein n=1 Tax=Streptomyces lydicus TaxID=47763 RepID=UPI0036E1AC11